jgi:SAM-dependent methyltransferase
MLDEYLGDLELAPAPGERVLEVGCGTGAVARRIVERFDGVDVVGVDPSPAFVEHARRLAEGLDRVSFVVGDGRELPVGDGEFDAVVCHTCSVTSPALSGCWRRRPEWPRPAANWPSSTATGAAEALQAEARRRGEDGTFFGHIAYLSLVAQRG